MTNTLILKSSLLGTNSVSSAMADAFLANLMAKNPRAPHVVRDLGETPLPHLRGDVLGQMRSDAAEVGSQATEGKKALAELLATETLVLAIPMYNFSIPSTLSA